MQLRNMYALRRKSQLLLARNREKSSPLLSPTRLVRAITPETVDIVLFTTPSSGGGGDSYSSVIEIERKLSFSLAL